jgi:hypothetical protein
MVIVGEGSLTETVVSADLGSTGVIQVRSLTFLISHSNFIYINLIMKYYRLYIQ